MLNFFVSGLRHESETVSFFFKNVLTSNSSYMLQNINIILKEFNINYIDLFNIEKSKLRTIINCKSGDPDWRSSIIMDLLSIRDNQTSCILSPEEVATLLKDVSTSR